MQKTRINIYISEGCARRLKAFCDKHKRSYGEVVESLLFKAFSTASPKGETPLSQHQAETRRKAQQAMRKVYSEDRDALIATAVNNSDTGDEPSDLSPTMPMPTPTRKPEEPVVLPLPQEATHEKFQDPPAANALNRRRSRPVPSPQPLDRARLGEKRT